MRDEVLRTLPRELEVRDDDDALDRGQARDDRGHLVEDRQRLAVVPVAVDDEQHRGSIWPKRSSTPCTPKSGEHDDHTAPRLVAPSIATIVSGMLGRYAATRSPAATPGCLQRRGHARPVAAIRSACDTRRASLSSPRKTSASPASSAAAARQQVLREIETRVRKPSGAGHARAVDERALAARPDDAGVVPDGRARTPHDPRSTIARAPRNPGTPARSRPRRGA